MKKILKKKILLHMIWNNCTEHDSIRFHTVEEAQEFASKHKVKARFYIYALVASGELSPIAWNIEDGQ